MGATFNPTNTICRVLATDESRTSTTTATPLAGLSVSVLAGEEWIMQATLYVTTAGTAGGFLVAPDMPAGTTFRGSFSTALNGGLLQNGMLFSPFTAATGSGDFTAPGPAVRIEMSFTITTNGAITLTAAQNSANATPTVFKANSYVIFSRVP